MKISSLLATLLLGLAGTANAYESFQSFSVYYPNTPWVRGTFNNWSKSALVAATAYKYSGVSYVGYVNVLAGSQLFKFDTSTNGDWSVNYGDNYFADACLDQNGGNLYFNQGAGTYEVRYSTGTPGYGCGRPFYQLTKLNAYLANQRTLYLRTSFNDWKPLPMLLVKNYVWEAEISGAPNTTGALKFDVAGDWSKSFGRPKGSDIRSYTDSGYASTVNGDNLGLYIEDYSGAAIVTAKFRFNDQTNEFSICYPGSTKAICQ